MAIGTPAMSDAIDSKKISRRSIVAGIAALGVYGFARNARAAETRPLAERLAAYAAALRYEDLDPATVERVKSHVIDTLVCGIAAFDERPVRVCREIAQPPFVERSRRRATSRPSTGPVALPRSGPARFSRRLLD